MVLSLLGEAWFRHSPWLRRKRCVLPRSKNRCRLLYYLHTPVCDGAACPSLRSPTQAETRLRQLSADSPMSYRIPLSSGSKENSSGRPGMEAQNKTIAPAQTGRLCAGATTDLTREMTCRGAPAVESANHGAAALDQKQQDDHGQDAAYDPNDIYVIHFASPFLMGKNFFERLGHNDGFGPQSHQENGRKYEEDQRKYQLHRGLRRLLFHLLAALSS
jgi:hypothetical protein